VPIWSEFVADIFLPIFVCFTLDPLNALPNIYAMIIRILFVKIQSWYLDCARVLAILNLDYLLRIQLTSADRAWLGSGLSVIGCFELCIVVFALLVVKLLHLGHVQLLRFRSSGVHRQARVALVFLISIQQPHFPQRTIVKLLVPCLLLDLP
jgi:hypothetical protein